MEKIIGIGTDQVECERVIKACEKESFQKRCFTEKEIELITKKKRSAATNFAGKEAVAKAFGTGFYGISLVDIEILRRENGAPYVVLYANAKKKAEELGITDIHISLSDTEREALAFVVAVGTGC